MSSTTNLWGDSVRMMMKMFLMLLFAAAALAQPDQPPDTLWTRTSGSGSAEIAYAVALTADDHALVVGSGQAPGSGDSDFYAVYMTSLGDTVWTRFYGTESSEVAKAVRLTQDGNFLLVGTETQFGNVFVVKISADGAAIWSRYYGGNAVEEGLAVTMTNDGNYLIAGSSSSGGSARDVFLLKINSSGDSLWSSSFGGSGDQSANAVLAISDGAMVVGWTALTAGAFDAYVARISNSGSVTWARSYGVAGIDEACGLLTTLDNGFVIAGSTNDIRGAGQSDYFLLKVAGSGDSLWMHTYGTTAWEHASAVQPASDGGYVIGGTGQNIARGDYDFRLIKVSATGEQNWAKEIGGQNNDYCYGMDKARDGGYIMAGWTNSFGNGSLDFYTVRTAGFSGVGGVITDEVTGQPVAGGRIAAIGESALGVSDEAGNYVLVLPPGMHDLIVYGPCVERDTIYDVTVIEDSIITVDIAIGLPDGRIPQTSVNIVAQNHRPSTGTLQIQNFGHGLLDYYAVVGTTEPATPWLSVAPSSGSLAQGEVEELTLTVTADTTDTGTYDYFGFLDVHMNSCPDSVIHVVVTAVVVNSESEHEAALAAQYSLGAFPNPFNPVTNVSWTLVREQEIRLDLFDIGGRKVAELASGRYASGDHRTQLDARTLPSGVYFARLSGDDIQLVTKLMLMK